MRTRENRWRLGGLLAAVVLAPVVLALLTGVATVHSCVPAVGRWADVGLRLALVRPDGACPEGTLALGGEEEQVLAVAVGITLPALVIHVATLGGALGLARVLRSLAGAVARHLLPAVPRAAARLPVAARAVVLGAPLHPRGLHLHQVKLRRGPPLPV